ncbi:MAG TPA: hypothetical protein VFM21_01245, partial [Terriglobia bacterium]|nr:hypothetical protein [Terriglobia bacterium]
MLWPPVLKVWQDGRVVFYKDKQFLSASLPPDKLEKLRSKLKAEKFLRSTRYIETKHGSLINIHGGVVYMRYLEGEQQVLLATEVFPRRGKWNKVIS